LRSLQPAEGDPVTTLHQNAKTCPASRVLMAKRVVEEGWSLTAAAEAAGVSERRCSEWVRRYRSGDQQLIDRSSAPRRVPHKTPPERAAAIGSLRELRFTAAEIAETLGMAHSTVSAVLRRLGMGRLPRLDGDEPDNRYERPMPGELVHIDDKKLASIGRPGHRVNGDRRTRTRGIGWEFVHVCVDDCTRLAYVEVLDDERTPTVCGFLERAIAWFAARGVRIERVMTDNGPAYRSHRHAELCQQRTIKHLFTAPYRPRTNGKAERFIRTLTNGWAYGAIYRNSRERRLALAGWMDHYNYIRPHRSLDQRTPAQRLAERNNAVGAYT
jgi:transposase InsO family protein